MIDGSPETISRIIALRSVDREERRLLIVLEDRDDDAVGQTARPREDVEMAVRQGVERAGVEGDALRHALLPLSVVDRAKPFGEQIIGGDGQKEREAREERDPPGLLDPGAARSTRIPPHETAGAGRPTPRNDSAASARIAQPTPNAAETISGGRAFGSRCRDENARRRGPHRPRRARVVELPRSSGSRPARYARRPPRSSGRSRRSRSRATAAGTPRAREGGRGPGSTAPPRRPATDADRPTPPK